MKNIELIYLFTKTNIKLKIERTTLGIFWFIINPLILLGVLYFIFSKNIGQDIQNYGLYVLIGVVTWNFFRNSTLTAISSLDRYRIMIKNMNIPKSVLVISSVMSVSILHILDWLIIFIVLILTNKLTIYFPFIFFILILNLLLNILISFLLTGVYSHVKDIENIWMNSLFIGWFLTPIFYDVNMLTPLVKLISQLNPIYWIIQIYRELIINNVFMFKEYLLILTITLIALPLTYKIFSTLIKNVAERI
jgi:ABC-type polysaccharide/polyol phosphate export permease